MTLVSIFDIYGVIFKPPANKKQTNFAPNLKNIL